jgi:hypothetical protein
MRRAVVFWCALALALGDAACAAQTTGRTPMNPFTATAAIPPGQKDAAAFLITLHVENRSGAPVAILNPDMGVPDPVLRWPFSQEAYQTAVLLSFHFLALSVFDDAGHQLQREGIDARTTPVVRPPLQVPPGGSFELSIPVGVFYRLAPGRSYRVAIEYGDKSLKVAAQGQITVP